MIVFIVERGGKEELLKISRLPFVFGKENADFSDPSMEEEHFVIVGFTENEIVGTARAEVFVNGEKLKGELHVRLNDELEIGNVKLTLVQVDPEDIEVEEQKLESLSQPTQFLNIDETDIAYLKFLSGPEAGKILELDHSGVIGRDPSVEYVIEDPYISRKQAKIYVLGDKYEIEDLGGKNPLIVNGKVVKGRKELHSGDEIQMGKTRALFINPREKPESEILKSRGVPRWIYGLILLMILALAGLGSAFYFYQKNQTYTSYINLAQGTLGSLSLYETTQEKVKELKSALDYLNKAEKIKPSEKVASLKEITQKYLEAWTHVLNAENLAKEGKVAGAISELEKTRGVLIDKETGDDDPYVLRLYDNLLKVALVQESYIKAKKLFESGKPDEALQILDIALRRVPDHPQLVELRNIIEESKKSRKKITQEEAKKRLAMLRKIKPRQKARKESTPPQEGPMDLTPKLDISVPKPEEMNLETAPSERISLESKLDYVINLKRAYEIEHDLDKTIRLATQALQDNPNNSIAKTYRELARREKKARAYEKRGDYKRALSEWRTILRLDPRNKWAHEAITRLSIYE